MHFAMVTKKVVKAYSLSSLFRCLSQPSPTVFLPMLAVQVLTLRAVWLPGIETVDKGFFSCKTKRRGDQEVKGRRVGNSGFPGDFSRCSGAASIENRIEYPPDFPGNLENPPKYVDYVASAF